MRRSRHDRAHDVRDGHLPVPSFDTSTEHTINELVLHMKHYNDMPHCAGMEQEYGVFRRCVLDYVAMFIGVDYEELNILDIDWFANQDGWADIVDAIEAYNQVL